MGVSVVRSALIQSVVLLIVAGIPTWATAYWGIQWRPAPPVRSLPVKTAQAEASKTVWIDVRNAEDFDAGHVHGAIPFDEHNHDLSLEAVLKVWTPKMRVVVYGAGIGSDRAERVAIQLKKDLRSPEVYLLEGGWAVWPRN